MAETETTLDLIVYPRTGQVVARDDLVGATALLDEIGEHERELKEVKRALQEVVVEYWRVHGGSKTIEVGSLKVVIGATEDTVYDPHLLVAGLLEAGMPEESIRQIVVETVDYKVDATKAKQAAAANPAYAIAVAAASSKRPKNPTVSVKVG